MTAPNQRTPLYETHQAAGARIIPFSGWELPVQYPTGILAETRAVRTAAGLFDVSHMGRLYISGPQAPALLDHTLTAAAATLPPGKARYSLICNPAGGIIDDTILYRLPPTPDANPNYLLIPNAGNRHQVLTWLQNNLIHNLPPHPPRQRNHHRPHRRDRPNRLPGPPSPGHRPRSNRTHHPPPASLRLRPNPPDQRRPRQRRPRPDRPHRLHRRGRRRNPNPSRRRPPPMASPDRRRRNPLRTRRPRRPPHRSRPPPPRPRTRPKHHSHRSPPGTLHRLRQKLRRPRRTPAAAPRRPPPNPDRPPTPRPLRPPPRLLPNPPRPARRIHHQRLLLPNP